MFVAQNLGKQFIKLTQVKTTDLAEDIIAYDGEHTYLLDCYTLADDAYDTVEAFANIADKIDNVEVVTTVAVFGSSTGDVRCYTNNVQALVLEDGTMYMDEALHDNIFC